MTHADDKRDYQHHERHRFCSSSAVGAVYPKR